MDKKREKQSSLIETGILSIVVGVMIGILDAKLWLLVVLLTGAGIAAIALYFLSKSEFDILWKNLNLARDNVYPKLVKKTEKNKTICYKFRVPAGIGVEDFEKNKSAIVQYFGHEVLIKREGKLVCIEVDISA